MGFLCSEKFYIQRGRMMHYPLTPIDWKRRAIKYYPSKVAVIDEEKTFTYAQFGERTDRLSQALLKAGINEGEHVAVMLPNTHYMLECFYGICQMGAVMVPLNYRISSQDMEYIINHSDAKLLIVDAAFTSSIQEIRANLNVEEIVVVAVPGYECKVQGIDYEDFIQHVDSVSFSPINLDENQLLTINYTSGTTSKPKGVMQTHRSNYMNAADFMFHLGVRHQDVYLHTLPMFHVNGWGGVWAITAVGGVHVCLRKVEPKVILDLFEQQQITLLCGAPIVINMLVNEPKVKEIAIQVKPRMAIAGSPPASALIQQAQDLLGLDIVHVYGMTETSPFILYNEWKPLFDQASVEKQAVLKARQGIEMVFNGETKVVSQDGKEVAWNGEELGEIVTRGNVVMKGYYKDREQTQAAFRDGWFHTGDLAVIHPDGYIEIRDRAKDIIISGGENISSTEIEGILYKHPAVLEAAVIAVPDDKWGEVPLAIIVLKENYRVTEEDVITYCRDNMAHFKAPKKVEFVNELPKTATGKLQKFRLRKMYWNSEKQVN